jgi:aminomethyltransferase
VIDDLIVYRNNENDFFLIPNASNTTDVVADLKLKAPSEIEIVNLHEAFGVIALQGPLSKSVLSTFGINPEMDYMAFDHVKIAGCEVILCRTGYTGEHGYEIVPSWSDAEKIWDALAAAIAPLGGLVCGLGARDTLRTEMGYPLHGHELTLEITPVQAAATWAIGWEKVNFSGSNALREEKAAGVHPRIRALVSQDRGIPRAGMQVKNSSGEVIGTVTSGTFSPTLKKGIALALISHSSKLGDQVIIDVRGRDSVAEVSKLPLVTSNVR